VAPAVLRNFDNNLSCYLAVHNVNGTAAAVWSVGYNAETAFRQSNAELPSRASPERNIGGWRAAAFDTHKYSCERSATSINYEAAT
jgi:hypothetical protein